MNSKQDSYTNYSETFKSRLIQDLKIEKEKVEIGFANESAQKKDYNTNLKSSD